jgi:RNA polymerase sigma-70 factor (ECF subfamily)
LNKWNNQLIDKIIEGDTQAQACCYQEFSSTIYTSIYNICRNSANASDLLQDTFIDAFVNIGQYNRNYAFIAWIKGIAFNNTLNFIKREKIAYRAVEYLKEVPTIESSFNEVISQNNLLEYLLEKVSENERLILWLYIVEQYSHEEIANLVSQSPSYSKSIVSRCLQKLRNKSEVKQYASK